MNTANMRNILWIILWLNMILGLLNILRFFFFQHFYLLKQVKDKTKRFLRKRDYFFIAFETFIILCGPSVFIIGRQIFVNNMIIASDIYYFVNDFFHLIQLYKVIIILRSALRSSEFSSNRAYRVW